MATGATVSNLNKDKVASAVFPLPPLSEQKRIANIIETVIEKCR
jgi:type I restriction-modification system, S subunit